VDIPQIYQRHMTYQNLNYDSNNANR